MKMQVLRRIRRAALLTALAATLISCHDRKAPQDILPESYRAMDGDIALRKGTGLTSRAVMMADGGSDYSHCGIVAVRGNRVTVIHAVPDEPDFEGDVDRVKAEPIDEFYSGIRASKGCILRCSDRAAAARSARKAEEIFRRNTLFDHRYDLADTTEMYCSELVEAAYAASGIGLSEGRRHNIELPGLKFRNVILPSDFLKSSHLRQVAVFGK